MKVTVVQGYDFFCPKCESGCEVSDWDSVCDHPSTGWKEIECWYCKEGFFLHVIVTIQVNVINRASNTPNKDAL
jgi:hypothetical protein